MSFLVCSQQMEQSTRCTATEGLCQTGCERTLHDAVVIQWSYYSHGCYLLFLFCLFYILPVLTVHPPWWRLSHFHLTFYCFYYCVCYLFYWTFLISVWLSYYIAYPSCLYECDAVEEVSALLPLLNKYECDKELWMSVIPCSGANLNAVFNYLLSRIICGAHAKISSACRRVVGKWQGGCRMEGCSTEGRWSGDRQMSHQET